jgi:hypothetical protein
VRAGFVAAIIGSLIAGAIACSPAPAGQGLADFDHRDGEPASRAGRPPPGIDPESTIPDASSTTPDASPSTPPPPVDAGGTQVETPVQNPSGPEPTPEPTPDAAVATDVAPIPPPPAPVILRVHDITAGRIKAGVVYAHVVAAKMGSIATRGAPLPDSALASQFGAADIKPAELTADVIYAHDIHAQWIEIGESHVSQVKIDVITK